MTNREAMKLARRTAAAWISARLDSEWPERVADPEDRRRLRAAMGDVVGVLLHGRRRRRGVSAGEPRRELPVLPDAPTRVHRPSETVEPVEIPSPDPTVSGEDSTLRGEPESTLPPLDDPRR
jgi:hypothetical protein